MSRLSQTIDYINSTEVTQDDIKQKYTDIIIDAPLQKFKQKYQRNQREKRRLLLLELESL